MDTSGEATATVAVETTATAAVEAENTAVAVGVVPMPAVAVIETTATPVASTASTAVGPVALAAPAASTAVGPVALAVPADPAAPAAPAASTAAGVVPVPTVAAIEWSSSRLGKLANSTTIETPVALVAPAASSPTAWTPPSRKLAIARSRDLMWRGGKGGICATSRMDTDELGIGIHSYFRFLWYGSTMVW